jgi:hypothetical protein
VLPTRRSGITTGEGMTLKVIIMSPEKPKEAALYWREMGRKRFSEVPLEHVNRSVYRVTLPEEATQSDFEYYVRATKQDDSAVVYPATAPDLNQSVIIMKPHMEE